MKAAIGDIHGNFKALKQVLERSKFSYEDDTLILLGDIVDGHAQTRECVDELLKIKNVVFVRGNHDEWLMRYLSTGFAQEVWIQQGGANTLRSYGAKVKQAVVAMNAWGESGLSILDTSEMVVPVTHRDFFNKSVLYYVLDGMLFVHGGYNPKIPIERQNPEVLMWDRSLIQKARNGLVIKDFKKVFVGHTTTQVIAGNDASIPDCLAPLKIGKLWCVDTGAGWDGRLTLLDIDTEEFWQSDVQSPAGSKRSTYVLEAERL